MTQAAAAASVAAPALSLASGIMTGEGNQASDQFQSEVLAQKAQMGQAAAEETNADMVARLNQSLGNIDAVRAASGDSASAPTAAGLRGTAEVIGNQEKAIRVGNILQQSETDTAESSYLQSAGNFALTQGILGGLAGSASQIARTNWGTFGT